MLSPKKIQGDCTRLEIVDNSDKGGDVSSGVVENIFSVLEIFFLPLVMVVLKLCQTSFMWIPHDYFWLLLEMVVSNSFFSQVVVFYISCCSSIFSSFITCCFPCGRKLRMRFLMSGF